MYGWQGVDSEKWEVAISEHHTVVAVKNDVIAGFGDMYGSGYLDWLMDEANR